MTVYRRPLSSFGGTPDEALAKARTESAASLFLLVIDGAFQFQKASVWTSPLFLEGAPGAEMTWTSADCGIVLATGAGGSRLDRIVLRGPTVGTALAVSAAEVVLSDVWVQRWADGFVVEGNAQNGTNANRVSMTRLSAFECGTDGFRFHGGDANDGVLLKCAAFDCGVGFNDDSFLGNDHYSCAVEACGIGFKRKQPNPGASYVECYAEADSPCDVDAPSHVVGGFWAGGNMGTAAMPGGLVMARNDSVFAALGGSTPKEAFALWADGALPHGISHGARPWLPDWWTLTHASSDLGDILRMRQRMLWFPSVVQHGGYMSQRGTREVWLTAAEVPLSSGGGNLIDGEPWRTGDRVVIRDAGPGEPARLVCLSVSDIGVPTWGVESRVEVP